MTITDTYIFLLNMNVRNSKFNSSKNRIDIYIKISNKIHFWFQFAVATIVLVLACSAAATFVAPLPVTYSANPIPLRFAPQTTLVRGIHSPIVYSSVPRVVPFAAAPLVHTRNWYVADPSFGLNANRRYIATARSTETGHVVAIH